MSKDTWAEPADLLEMANVLGMDVKIEKIDFSFYIWRVCIENRDLQSKGFLYEI